MKVIVCAGGSGGHIYPALAIINKINEKEPKSDILYIGTTDRMEKDLIPSLGIKYEGIPMKGINRKNLIKNIGVFVCYQKAIKKAQKIIREFQPDIVIGVGGYITAPVVIAAKRQKCRILIHEQNLIPGISNKLIAKYADKICISLPGSKEYFKEEKVVYTGNPRSEEIIYAKKMEKSKIGFQNNKKLVIFVMGSLGSTTMMKKIKDIIPLFSEKDYQVLIVTGNNYYEEYKNIKVPNNVKLVPFLNDFIHLLKSSELIVSRAGASTIAEITAIGIPSILVPSPYVANDHQTPNAKELEENGASILITEDQFNGKSVVSAIDKIFNNKALYQKMQINAKKLGITDSATRIYNEIKKVIKD